MMAGGLDIQVLPMTIADVADILAITDNDPDKWNGAACREELQLPDRFCFKAWDPTRKKTAGFVIGRLVAEEAEVFKFAVHFSYRRRGIGALILKHALEFLWTKETNNCFLELRQSNVSARKLYEKAGFKLYSRRRDYYCAPSEDALLMKKTRPPAGQSALQTIGNIAK